ncbi:DEAD/DEAH box helicase family protein [Burkholderia seminalis]|uniref:DEAD/DEAH box helicase family protein n=1 Tax=Burkholderia seminalis TaxID=488731 RepID=A0A8A8D7P1_9BURK|nr:DEAD/DEAH box helicase family protein [Burkholderia seminalis]QTO20724.1 DEAD/DEAH box helicase family protein [Burkholderia seminalis]
MQDTILDSLAPSWSRPPSVVQWIDRRLQDRVVRADTGSGSALRNLKKVSHGKAVRELVERAAKANGLDAQTMAAMKKSAGDLYTVRSNLSHAGNTDVPDVGVHNQC